MYLIERHARSLAAIHQADSPPNSNSFLWDRVFSNKYIWLVSAANFFVYTIRFAVFDWGPTLLKEVKGIELVHAGWMLAGFEVAGLVGMITTGFLTDRWFGGRGRPAELVEHVALRAVGLFVLDCTREYVLLNTALLMSAGFFVYVPQALVAVVVANLATKRAAATAVGLTSVFATRVPSSPAGVWESSSNSPAGARHSAASSRPRSPGRPCSPRHSQPSAHGYGEWRLRPRDKCQSSKPSRFSLRKNGRTVTQFHCPAAGFHSIGGKMLGKITSNRLLCIHPDLLL